MIYDGRSEASCKDGHAWWSFSEPRPDPDAEDREGTER
jgi:hypothetical protein